jgi:hypothetical protein
MAPEVTSTGRPTVFLSQSFGGVQSRILLCHTSIVFDTGIGLQSEKHNGPQKGGGLNLSWIVFRHEEKALPSRVMVPVNPSHTSVVPSHPQSPAQDATAPFTYGATVKELRNPGQVFPVTWYVTVTRSGGPPVGFANDWSAGLRT